MWPVNFLNVFLRRQPATCALLAQHAGGTFHVCVRSQTIALTILHDGTLSPADKSIVPNVVLRIDLQKLMTSGWRPGQDWPDLPGLLHVTGDAAMAQTLSNWARYWRIEPADVLSDWIGDVAAQAFVDNTKALVQTVVGVGQNARDNLVEYLAYETRTVTPTPVLQDQTQNLETLKSQLYSLSARLKTLSERADRLQALQQRSSSSSGDLA